jgi:hypothetical protein
MKFFISILLIAVLSFAASLFMPWWIIAVVAFIVAFAIPQKNGMAFLSGFIAVFLLWVGLSFYISLANEHIFAHKISMLILKADSPNYIILVTGLIGALVAGFGALSGRLFKKII